MTILYLNILIQKHFQILIEQRKVYHLVLNQLIWYIQHQFYTLSLILLIVYLLDCLAQKSIQVLLYLLMQHYIKHNLQHYLFLLLIFLRCLKSNYPLLKFWIAIYLKWIVNHKFLKLLLWYNQMDIFEDFQNFSNKYFLFHYWMWKW